MEKQTKSESTFWFNWEAFILIHTSKPSLPSGEWEPRRSISPMRWMTVVLEFFSWITLCSSYYSSIFRVPIIYMFRDSLIGSWICFSLSYVSCFSKLKAMNHVELLPELVKESSTYLAKFSLRLSIMEAQKSVKYFLV